MHASRKLAALGLIAVATSSGAPLAPAAPAPQQVLLDEDFAGSVFPPSGWAEDNNGVSPGWEGAGGRAVHADHWGANDNRLVTPTLDFTVAGGFGLHAVHGQLFATYRDRNEVEVSVDGGLNWELAHVVEVAQDGNALPLEVDLSAWAGQSAVQIRFRYVGDFANEWTLDEVVVDDQPPVFPPHWPELPAAFVAWEGYCERFDGLAASLPPHLAFNSVEVSSRLPDPDGWCNVGQLAPCSVYYSGVASLELGLNPATSNYHTVANALIFGLNGTGATNTAFEMWVRHAGEESHADDGVFLSLDGEEWTPVLTDWELITGGPDYVDQWRKVTGDLADAGLPLDGDFYLAVAQADDFPFGVQDGVAIDDFCMGGDVVPFRYEITNLTGGQLARLEVVGADPDGLVSFLYSLVGPGPVQTPYGLAQVGFPYYTLATLDADRNGRVSFDVPVPSRLIGTTIWTQALEVLGTEGRFTNPLEEVVQ